MFQAMIIRGDFFKYVRSGVNEDDVPEDIGARNPDLRPGQPFADVLNHDFVPEDVIDKGATTSALLSHMSGSCQACVFISSPEGCKRGIDCRYCHFEHPVVQLEHRIRKSMRDRIKRRLEPLCFKDADLEAIHDDLQKEAAKHPLARIRIQAYLRTRGRTSCAHTGPSQGDFNAQPGGTI